MHLSPNAMAGAFISIVFPSNHFIVIAANGRSFHRQGIAIHIEISRFVPEHAFVVTDHFQKQTYIKRGKCCGGMKGISTSAEQVAVWINSFIVFVHLAIAMKHNMYDRVGDEEKPNG